MEQNCLVSNIVQVDAIERDSSGRRVEPRCLDNSVGMQGRDPGHWSRTAYQRFQVHIYINRQRAQCLR